MIRGSVPYLGCSTTHPPDGAGWFQDEGIVSHRPAQIRA